jgi:hypothetical protein
MAFHHQAPRGTERVQVQRGRQRQVHVQVVGDVVGLELLQEPQPFLLERAYRLGVRS